MRYAGGIYPTYGLKGQKRLAQGKANNVSDTLGIVCPHMPGALKGQKIYDGMRISVL